MKVVRFMSAAEAKLFIKDKRLKNTTDHKAAGNKTDSIGFCFMPVDGQEDDGIFYAARRLCGITTTEWCLVGDLAHDRWRKGYGVYADYNKPEVGGMHPPMEHEELSTKTYSRKDFTHFKLYKRNPLIEIDAAGVPEFIAALTRNSSVAWKEPVLVYCTCLDLDCVRGDIRKDELNAVQK